MAHGRGPLFVQRRKPIVNPPMIDQPAPRQEHRGFRRDPHPGLSRQGELQVAKCLARIIELAQMTTDLLRGGSASRIDNPKNHLARCEPRSEEHTSELQSRLHLVCRLLLEKKKKKK